jgi:hypothetical protein
VTATELLAEACQAGVEVFLDAGDKLRCRGRGTPPSGLLEKLAAAKAALIQLLVSRAAPGEVVPAATLAAHIRPTDLPPDRFFDYEERLAIMMVDGKLLKEEAEKWALFYTIRQMKETPVRSACPCANCRDG